MDEVHKTTQKGTLISVQKFGQRRTTGSKDKATSTGHDMTILLATQTKYSPRSREGST